LRSFTAYVVVLIAKSSAMPYSAAACTPASRVDAAGVETPVMVAADE
jgi:hypothetical protein